MKTDCLPIRQNPLKSRSDVQQALRQLTDPLAPFFSEGGALVTPGQTAANYPLRSAQMEAFSRPLWGLVPLVAGGGQSELWPTYLQGLKNGTNPDHPEYWGDLGDIDQRMVEMPPIALGLLLLPEHFWQPLTDAEKNNLVNWLGQINHHAICGNNWLFFAVLVNLALKKIGVPYNDERLSGYLKRIDEFYIADGWYSDGKDREQRDYYTPFAIYYYGLIYAAIMEQEDPEISGHFKDRARLFAKDFKDWFAADGSALPFGRSLTYRFAQAAFWGALAFAGVKALPWAQIKGLYMRNLRWWLAQPIFTSDGLLTIGYRYPNLNMSEGYNAPGSPYWALKAFLPLALPSDHPFWQAEEAPLPEGEGQHVQTHPHMIICHSDSRNHLFALHSGQWPVTQFVHNTAKYGKFAYSNVFGFSVPREAYGLSQGAYDSTLALSEGDGIYRTRRDCVEYRIDDNVIYSLWRPWADVEVRTWLVAAAPWHIRIHCIDSARDLTAAEGGFAIGDMRGDAEAEQDEQMTDAAASVLHQQAFSGIVNLFGTRTPLIVEAKANTNLINPRTLIPTLEGTLQKGRHYLGCAVLGEVAEDFSMNTWNGCPAISIADGVAKVCYHGREAEVIELRIDLHRP